MAEITHDLTVLDLTDALAEQRVLACCALSHDDYSAVKLARRHLAPADFFYVKHRTLFQAMLDMDDEGLAVTPGEVGRWLTEHKVMPEADLDHYTGAPGGLVAWMVDPENKDVLREHFDNSVKALRREALRRHVLQAATALATHAYDAPDQASLVDGARLLLERALARATAGAGPYPLADLVGPYWDALDNRLARQAEGEKIERGVPTGLYDLDHKLGGLRPGEMTIVAGRPGHGKTALGLQIARYVAGLRVPTVFVSLEMGWERLLHRLVANATGIDSRILEGERPLGDTGLAAVTEALADLEKVPLWVDDEERLTLPALEAKLTALRDEAGLGLVVIDYLQLLRSPRERRSRVDEVTDVAEGLVALAKRLAVPVLALAQLNREVEKRADPRPILSDLRDSGAIEQAADAVVMLWSEEAYDPGESARNIVKLSVAKNRSGPTGLLDLRFTPALSKFDNLSNRTQE